MFGVVYGLFKGFLRAGFIAYLRGCLGCFITRIGAIRWAHIICYIWPKRLRVLVLDYVMTCLVVVVRSNVDMCVLIY